jgi:hypothetical protein
MILNKMEPSLKIEGVCDCGTKLFLCTALSDFKKNNDKCIIKCSDCNKEFDITNIPIIKVNNSKSGIEVEGMTRKG